jgi:hypothetical protein
MPPSDALETGGVVEPPPLLPLLPPPPPPHEVSVIAANRTPKVLRFALILHPPKATDRTAMVSTTSCLKSTIFAVDVTTNLLISLSLMHFAVLIAACLEPLLASPSPCIAWLDRSMT